MAGDEEREPVPRAERPGGPSGPRPSSQSRELAVANDLAPGERSQSPLTLAVEAVVEVEQDVREVVAAAGEVRAQPFRQRMVGEILRRSRHRQLRPDDALGFEPQLAHSPAGNLVPYERGFHARCCSFGA